MSTDRAISTANFLPEFERIAARLPGGTRMLERRHAALARFATVGFPTIREEAWKYTNVAALGRKRFVVPVDGATIDEATLAILRGGAWEGPEILFVNGRHHPELSRGDAGVNGLRVRPLTEVMREEPEAVEALGGLAEADASAFVALNAAFFGDGIHVEIAPDTVIEQPIHLLFATVANGSALACFPRVVIKLGKGARVRIAESYRGTEASEGLTNAVTEIIAGEGSKVEHYRVQDEARKTFHIGSLFVDQARGSEVVLNSLSLGALLARQDIRVRLDATDAGVTMNGLYLADGRQHVDHHTRVDHLQPHTRSAEYYKGVLGGFGRGVFNGRVVVHPRAFKTDAQQSNKNLLLSKDAEVDTKPELEIYADDVKCAHGATVGQLDANALFYLRSRGLPQAQAQALLSAAFCHEPLNVLDARLTEQLTAQLSRALAVAGVA